MNKPTYHGAKLTNKTSGHINDTVQSARGTQKFSGLHGVSRVQVRGRQGAGRGQGGGREGAGRGLAGGM